MDSSSEPTPLVGMLRLILSIGKQLAKNPKFSLVSLQSQVLRVRVQLQKIYGKDAPQLVAFPPVTDHEGSLHDELARRMAHVERMLQALEAMPASTATPLMGSLIFIGHGRSPLWRELKDFIEDRLGLPCDEFNREPVAGITTSDRLQGMLSQAAFAFLVMTAEEERADGTLHARPNVVHEVGLFQGHLGIRRAIVLVEDGCSEFSNIAGLTQLRFPRGHISARFEDIRLVLEREKFL